VLVRNATRLIFVTSLVDDGDAEAAATCWYGNRACVVRTGLAVGTPGSLPKFGYWFDRMARGGEVLAPGAGSRIVPLIDVRDLASFVVTLILTGKSGVFDATTATEPRTMLSLLEEFRSISTSESTFTWVSDSFLVKHGLTPEVSIPLWLTSEQAERWAGWEAISAVDAGLRTRPLAEIGRACASLALRAEARG